MLFRPSFCAHCGEKIERSDWGLFTSRRFCAVCESELKAHDLVPRVVVGLGILIGIFGIGSYLKAGNEEPRLVKTSAPPVERPAPAQRDALPANVTVPTPAPVQAASASNAIPQAKSPVSLPPATQVAKNLPSDVVYMCGAMTKKGTPCTRRVHGPIRCFQHQGMPPMVPQEKLRIS
ncbi:MAG: hypothetical protein ACJ73D_09470 [Pyrinomonadaceae bacterium]